MKKTDVKHLMQMFKDNISPRHCGVIHRGHIVEPGSAAFEFAYEHKMYVTDEKELSARNPWLVVLNEKPVEKEEKAPEKPPQSDAKAVQQDKKADAKEDKEDADDDADKPKRGRKPKSEDGDK